MTQPGQVVFSKMEEVRLRQAGRRDRGRARPPPRRRAGVPDGERHAQPDDRRDRQAAPRARQQCVGTFDTMPAHTPRAAVIAAAEQAREASADLIVTLGGGSITDGAKAVQLCLANDIRTPEAMDAVRARPAREAAGVPQISDPDHAVGRRVLRHLRRHRRAHQGEGAVPPRRHRAARRRARSRGDAAHAEWLWLSTGIRAVDHCVEGICSNEASPYGDAQALHGLALLARGLPKVKADPNDLAARLDCQLGSWLSMAPLVAGVPMGASHGIGYVLGAVFDIPHGHTSCIMLPSVMRWNKSANAAAPGAGRRRDGPSRRGCRRRARRLHPRPRHAAQPRRGEGRPGAFRPHRQAGDGHALGAAQSAADRGAGAGEGDIGAGGVKRPSLHFAAHTVRYHRPSRAAPVSGSRSLQLSPHRR